MPIFRTIILFFLTFCWATVGIVTVFIDPTGHLYMFVARNMWSRQILWFSGIQLTIKGAEKIDWSNYYVVCANHFSQLDIPLLFFCLPIPIRFLAKRSLFFVPVFGWSLYLARFIAVDRGRHRKAREIVDRAVNNIKKGPSLVVFPEGTRSEDGRIHKFKSGAFSLAIRASVPVLPVAIRGTYEIVPKTRLSVFPGPVQVTIGEPIDTADLDPKEAARLGRRVQEEVEKMFES